MLGHPKVCLGDLLQPTSTCTETWETAVEKLAVSLSRDRVCVLSVPTPHSAAYAAALRSLPKELQSHAPARLGGGGFVSPGSASLQLRAGAASNTVLEVTYGYLEATARAVLQALCRSRLLRLRGDTFSDVLDDLPLPRSQQGSSTLTLKAYMDNFQESSEGQAPIFSDPQEETVDRGLLSVMVPQEARDPQRGPLSVMQVKDAAGKWQDVVLKEGEAVLLLGHTMRHATAGILSPASYRVAGDPYGTEKGQSRRLLHFELRPRPAAVLDFTRQLEEAGHQVPPKYAAPVGVHSLMQQFEQLMSPGKDVHTPQNMEGVAAHTAWDQATSKKGRKRTSDAADLVGQEDSAPVTRSGNVRRTSGGLVNQHRPTRFQQQAAAAAAAAVAAAGAGDATTAAAAHASAEGQPSQMSAGSGGSGGSRPSSAAAGPSSDPSQQQQQRRPLGGSLRGGGAGADAGAGGSLSEALRRRRASLEPSSSCSALYFVRGHTCTVLDGCLQDAPSHCISLCVRSFTGIERWFYLNRSLSCGRVFETYCDRMGISLGSVKFLHKGTRIFGADTPEALQVADGEEFTAVPETSDRLLQARELGPLYASLFDAGAATADLPI